MKTNNKEPGEGPSGPENSIKIKRFRPVFENPDHTPRAEAARILRERLPGIWFINPIARVHAECDSPEFLEVVRKRQGEWFRHLSRQLGNGWRTVKRETTCEHPKYNEAFEFDGVIIHKQILMPVERWIYLRTNVPEFALTSREAEMTTAKPDLAS